MSTVVLDKAYANSSSRYSDIVSDVTDLWDWADISTVYDGTMFKLHVEDNFGLMVYNGNSNFTTIAVRFGSSSYHIAGPSSTAAKLLIKAERVGEDTLILSVWRVSDSPNIVSANLCDKYIICRGVNTITEEEETVLVYLGSNSTSGTNKCMLLAGDVMQATDIAAQNANANVNAKNTNIIPFFSPASVYITKDVYQSLCSNVSSWYFSDVILNDKPYRMSGSVFVLDE
ncbi:hypothetical protein [Ruminococcus sp.]|uniref:hypothetical protein n=1 Tax=Ruminococcus sp. TaxID=41978 RepID=UPI0025E6F36A|nr:hypothetical protein [Ruminococcus sp.]MCR4638296.1 hypothetical protein [Ruminococcus sp.]